MFRSINLVIVGEETEHFCSCGDCDNHCTRGLASCRGFHNTWDTHDDGRSSFEAVLRPAISTSCVLYTAQTMRECCVRAVSSHAVTGKWSDDALRVRWKKQCVVDRWTSRDGTQNDAKSAWLCILSTQQLFQMADEADRQSFAWSS